jgi:hypothetical protein
MSQAHDVQEIPKHVEAGRLLSERLRIAREMSGSIVCPSCNTRFDATHVVKCPECRTFIDDSFRAVSSGKKRTRESRNATHRKRKPLRKARLSKRVKEKVELELDFFTQGYMEYKE